jgi:hypothetical protein
MTNRPTPVMVSIGRIILLLGFTCLVVRLTPLFRGGSIWSTSLEDVGSAWLLAGEYAVRAGTKSKSKLPLFAIIACLLWFLHFEVPALLVAGVITALSMVSSDTFARRNSHSDDRRSAEGPDEGIR